jgi:hydrogenase expression/formation protein HypD
MIKYIDDFRQELPVQHIVRRIKETAPSRQVRLMEICGGHTNAIFRFGIRELLPESINLLSGPGCPVCVTPNNYIDTAIELAGQKDVIITTFGDMIRVPGSRSSLLKQRENDRDIRICLSPMDAVRIAEENPRKKVIFLGIGFETTAPGIGVSILTAQSKGCRNYYVLCALKTMPRALVALMDSGDVNIHGFICPGHVSAITGFAMYEPIAENYHIPCVVSGFEPTDILKTIEMIISQIVSRKAIVENQYTRSVKYQGNPTAKEIMARVFTPCDSSWRGIGIIPGSGLAINDHYAEFDALNHFHITLPEEKETPGCMCGDIMRGVKTPLDCGLFAGACTPENPKGACMVSAEGTCAAYYRYRKNR